MVAVRAKEKGTEKEIPKERERAKAPKAKEKEKEVVSDEPSTTDDLCQV